MQEFWKNSKIYLGVFSILIVGVLLLTPELMLIMGGNQYYSARFVMPPVIMGCVFQFAYGMYVNLEIYEKKTIVISIGTIGAAVLNIVLNMIFIPKYGYLAAAYTTLVGYAALFIFHYLIVKLLFVQYNDIYDKGFLLIIITALLICSSIALVLYRFLIIRYCLAVLYFFVLGIGVIKYQKTLKKLLGISKKS